MIPGLLQTADYAAASARASGAITESDIERAVTAHMERQQLLQGDLEVLAILDENALLRLAHSPDIAKTQLFHLIELGESLDRITIQVLPPRASLHASMGPGFVILDYASELNPSLIYLESRAGGTLLEKNQDLDDYRKVFTSLMRPALSEAQKNQGAQEVAERSDMEFRESSYSVTDRESLRRSGSHPCAVPQAQLLNRC